MSPARSSAVTRLREDLLASLLDGSYPSGSKLPNEDEIAESAGVSRATVREAVGNLVEAGYLQRRHGSGTYVARTLPRRHALDMSVSYMEMISEAGLEPRLVLLDYGVQSATEADALVLEVEEGEPLMQVERIRTADGRPVVYSIDRLPLAFVPDSERDLQASLYDVLARAGHPVAGASAKLTPVVAEERLAALLHVEAGTPLLHIDQVDFDQDRHPVMLSSEWHVADAFEMHVNRRRGPERAEEEGTK
jgi:GntR family transcriptional regulator